MKNLKLECFRSLIGVVGCVPGTSMAALLGLSIQENIAYGRSATTYQIEYAADIAHAHTSISSLGKGLTVLGWAFGGTQDKALRSSPSILYWMRLLVLFIFEAEKAVQEALWLSVQVETDVRVSLFVRVRLNGIADGQHDIGLTDTTRSAS